MRNGFTRRLGLAATAVAGAAAIAWALSPPASVEAQRGPSATTVAAWVQSFYDQTRTMSADFRQRYNHRVYNRIETSNGRVRFKKPGRMRFDYADPNGKVVVTDGDELTVYEPPDAGQSRGQYYQQPMSQAQLPDALSFLTGTGQLAQDYRFRLLRLDAPGHEVLELRPRRPTASYSRVLLYVDSSEARRGVVDRVVIVDQSNNTNQFDFRNQRFNTNVNDNVFQYRPPGNARRIRP